MYFTIQAHTFNSHLFLLGWDTTSMIQQLELLTGLWVWSPWGGLRARIFCTHFQQILNQSHMKFSVV
jgi:hypothetical protein